MKPAELQSNDRQDAAVLKMGHPAALLIVTFILCGCSNFNWQSPSDLPRCEAPKYVLHDVVEHDYWTGEAHRWSTLDRASTMSHSTAEKVLQWMRENEEGGYANVPDSESKFPVVIEIAGTEIYDVNSTGWQTHEAWNDNLYSNGK